VAEATVTEKAIAYQVAAAKLVHMVEQARMMHRDLMAGAAHIADRFNPGIETSASISLISQWPQNQDKIQELMLQVEAAEKAAHKAYDALSEIEKQCAQPPDAIMDKGSPGKRV
jgi:hypothetical protein